MRKTITFLVLIFFFAMCHHGDKYIFLASHKKFIDYILLNDSSFYSLTKSDSLHDKRTLAIGIFDSGIGGLTVFDAIVNADFFNEAHENQPDGIKDFCHEQFIYFADQANMPYSNYVEEGEKELLEEHIIKDALFLLNNKFHLSQNSPVVVTNKPTIKAMVIVCNTATAYGKQHVEELCRITGNEIKVIGVIDAGCKGALEVIGDDENVTLAIFATPATVASMAYVNTLNELKKKLSGISVIQQGGKGLAEAIDNKPEYINRSYSKPYPEYQGPSLSGIQYRIEKHLLPYYNFDTTDYQILYNKNSLLNSDTIEINSVENYTRYHVVSLAEQLKEKPDSPPLKLIILGCTHYPYVSNIIRNVLDELKRTERYGNLLADSVYLIDPALNTAQELYKYLSDQQLFNDNTRTRLSESRFSLSVPNVLCPYVETGNDGSFTYAYQYKKRSIGELKDYTLIVPFSGDLISDEQIRLIQFRLPFTYELLKNEL